HAPVRAYRESLAFVRWLDGRAKPDGVRSVVADLRKGYTPDAVLRRTTGLDVREAEIEWRLSLGEKHSILEALARSSAVWWGLLSVLAVLAIARYLIVSRRLRRKLAREDEA